MRDGVSFSVSILSFIALPIVKCEMLKVGEGTNPKLLLACSDSKPGADPAQKLTVAERTFA